MEPHTVRRPVSRLLPLMPKISKTLRHHQDDPLASSHNDLDLEFASRGVEKPGRGSSPRKKLFNKAHTASKSRAAAVPPRKSPRTLMTLPHEIQIMVLSYLGFGDIIRLRRTSLYWQAFATPQLLRTVHGPERLHTMLLQHCRHCLNYCPVDTTRTATTSTDPGYPLSSRCVTCVVQSKDDTIRVGRQVTLADAIDYWACRWCGWPVILNPEAGQPEFHKRCYNTYFFVGVLSWLVLGCVQFVLGVVGSALVWHYFRPNVSAVVTTAIAFVLSWVCLLLIASRDCYAPTYYWSLLVETGILILWISPMRAIARKFTQGDSGVSTQATMAFVALNILFRLVNVLGNLLLLYGYDRTRHHLPRVHVCRRAINALMTGLVIWTYPQHVYRQFLPFRDEESADDTATA